MTPGPVGQAHEGGPYGFQTIRVYVIPHIRAVTVIADFTIIAAAVHQRDIKHQHADPSNSYEMALIFCMKHACQIPTRAAHMH
ncbi:MAG: hypothetical protein OXH76_20075 [Boseongicola sp.]|nr:hypothetical protein [Boseongicola sp.]